MSTSSGALIEDKAPGKLPTGVLAALAINPFNQGSPHSLITLIDSNVRREELASGLVQSDPVPPKAWNQFGNCKV